MKVLNRIRGLRTIDLAVLAAGGLLVATGSPAVAGGPVKAPEIDAGSMVTAVMLLSGCVLVVTNRARRK